MSRQRPVAGPIWYDLPAADQSKAKAFYGQLFGWEFLDAPMGPGSFYSSALIGEEHVAAIFTEHAGLRRPDGMQLWVHHFWSDDVEATVGRCEEFGGDVMLSPYEIPGAGIKAVCATPEGAPFGVWSSDHVFGVGLFAEPNTVCWTEYYTRDVGGANRFFEKVLNVSFRRDLLEYVIADGETYEYHWMVIDGEEQRGGMLEMDEEWGDMPSHFMLYFAVEDCEGSVDRAVQLGGKIQVPPTEIPTGKFALIEDPQGGKFSVIALKR